MSDYFYPSVHGRTVLISLSFYFYIAGDSLVLKDVSYKKNDMVETWDDVVKSLIMYTDESDEENEGSKWDRDNAV